MNTPFCPPDGPILNEATWTFVRQHANDDVRHLALSGTKNPDVDVTMALQQIQGRQTARQKLPTWASCKDVVFPPHLSMEQCSSEQTALYKALLVAGFEQDSTSEGQGGRPFLVDLTGGLGVDFFFMARRLAQPCIYVEQQEHLCRLAYHNFQVLGLSQATVVHADCEEFLQQLDRAEVIFLDPARRDSHGARTYAISDCTPDVLQLLDTLLDKCRVLVIKLSPMLDWHKAVDDLNHCGQNALQVVREVHIVSVANECKELLLVLSRQPRYASEPLLCCVNDNQRFTTSLYAPPFPLNTLPFTLNVSPSAYLYEPNASVMKAGCFTALAQAYQLKALAPNSHLFVSSVPVDSFPGRRFLIRQVSTLNHKEISHALKGVTQANVAVRNFPLKAEELRRRLKLRDGGTTYVFGTTLNDGRRVVILCTRI